MQPGQRSGSAPTVEIVGKRGYQGPTQTVHVRPNRAIRRTSLREPTRGG